MGVVRGKDDAGLTLVVDTPVSFAKVAAALHAEDVDLGPKDRGTVDMIVQRPDLNKRRVVERVELTRQGGMAGSGWVLNPERGLVDQLCVMSTVAIRAIAGEPDRWPPAGDQLFINLNLSKANLKVGDRVRIGGATCAVTKKPHNGCAKFAKRYGPEALKVVNAPLSKERRIRGIYFEVLEDGVVCKGDEVVVLRE